jgi:hypothetical protein
MGNCLDFSEGISSQERNQIRKSSRGSQLRDTLLHLFCRIIRERYGENISQKVVRDFSNKVNGTNFSVRVRAFTDPANAFKTEKWGKCMFVSRSKFSHPSYQGQKIFFFYNDSSCNTITVLRGVVPFPPDSPAKKRNPR